MKLILYRFLLYWIREIHNRNILLEKKTKTKIDVKKPMNCNDHFA